jgi:hypothetical protein
VLPQLLLPVPAHPPCAPCLPHHLGLPPAAAAPAAVYEGLAWQSTVLPLGGAGAVQVLLLLLRVGTADQVA